MVLLYVFIGVAAPVALLGFAVGALVTSIDQDVEKELHTKYDSERWVNSERWVSLI
jgi:hypothetical protein